MSIKEAKALYVAMLDSGELLDFYPNLIGEWEKDKSKFLKEYESNNRMIDGDEGFIDSPFDNEFDY